MRTYAVTVGVVPSVSIAVSIVLSIGVSIGALACSSGKTASEATPATTTTGTASGTPTFHKDIEPILQRHCQGCHVAGGIAPMPLVTYADAQAYAGVMTAKTASRAMPPWGAVATSDCTPGFGWKDDPTLTQAQIDTFAAWSRAGAPEGDPKDAPPPSTPAPIALPNVTAEATTAAPYAITDRGTDQFRCFVLDPKVTATTWMDGAFIVPGNKSIVHHVLVYTDPTRAAPSKVTDAATQSYECFGSAGVPNQNLLAAWAPGGVPTEYPPSVAAQLPANTLLVMQVHYHPHSTAASLAPDQTKFQMRFVPQKPTYQALTVLLGNFANPVDSTGTGLLAGPDDPNGVPTFLIPANKSGHTETMQFTMPATIKGFPTPTLPILGVAGHEHYVGVAEQVTIHRATQAAGMADECLLAIPHWDFDWQRGYSYDAPIASLPTIAANDQLFIKCTYDNTLANPKVAQSLADQMLTQPRDVHLGETTLDEMCLAPLVLLAPAL